MATISTFKARPDASSIDRPGSQDSNPYGQIRTHFWTVLGVVLLAAAFASHWPDRHGFFLVDDFLWLNLGHLRSVAESFVGTQGAHVAYRPIFRTSVYIDYLLFGRNAMWWHFENIAIHAANALLLAAITRAFRLPLACCVAVALL